MGEGYEVRRIPKTVITEDILEFITNPSPFPNIMVMIGSTRCGKSYNACLAMCLAGVSPEILPKNMLLEGERLIMQGFRKDKTKALESMWKDFREILESRLGILNTDKKNWNPDLAKMNDNLHVITFPAESGATLSFHEAKVAHDVKSQRRHIAYVNEVNDIREDVFEQIQQRTPKTIIDLNPDVSPQHWVWKLKRQSELSGKVLWKHYTYRQNPFLKEAERLEIESWEPTSGNWARGSANPRRWKIFGLGEPAPAKGTIFDQRKIHVVPDEKFFGLPGGLILCWGAGADYGVTDPTTLIECKVLRNGDLWCHQRVYEKGLIAYSTDREKASVVSRFAECGLDKTLEIIDDSARPEITGMLSTAGFKIRSVNKNAGGEQGSILWGLSLMQARNIYVTESSTQTINEFQTYSWKENSRGDLLRDKPQDFNNHALDGIRYFMMENEWQFRNVDRIRGGVILDPDDLKAKNGYRTGPKWVYR